MTQRPSSPSVLNPTAAETVSVVESRTQQLDSSTVLAPSPHGVEYEVQRVLQNHPALKFSRLHVHRCQDGICLEGFLESNEYEIDLCDVVRGIQGVTGVINRIVLTRPVSIVPKKG
jgi:osmotically-inducible protein OsmY